MTGDVPAILVRPLEHGRELRFRVLCSELAKGMTPEAIARKYPDLWPSGEAVHAAAMRLELA